MLKQTGFEKLQEIRQFLCDIRYYNFDYFDFFDSFDDFYDRYIDIIQENFDEGVFDDEDEMFCECDMLQRFKKMYHCNKDNSITFLYNVDDDEYLTINFEDELYILSQNYDIYHVCKICEEMPMLNDELMYIYKGIVDNEDDTNVNEEDMLPYKQYFDYANLKNLLYEK